MLHKKCPHCSCLQPNGTFADLFRKLDFLKNEPQAKEKKAKTENESQSVSKKGNSQTRKIINSCVFTARKSLKQTKKDAHIIRCSLVTLIQKETNVESFEGTYYISREI